MLAAPHRRSCAAPLPQAPTCTPTARSISRFSRSRGPMCRRQKSSCRGSSCSMHRAASPLPHRRCCRGGPPATTTAAAGLVCRGAPRAASRPHQRPQRCMAPLTPPRHRRAPRFVAGEGGAARPPPPAPMGRRGGAALAPPRRHLIFTPLAGPTRPALTPLRPREGCGGGRALRRSPARRLSGQIRKNSPARRFVRISEGGQGRPGPDRPADGHLVILLGCKGPPQPSSSLTSAALLNSPSGPSSLRWHCVAVYVCIHA